MPLGQQIRDVRQKRQLSLAALANATGLTKGFLSQIEGGKSNPSVTSLMRIAQALQVPLEVLADPPVSASQTKRHFAGEPTILTVQSAYHDTDGLTPISDIQAGHHFIAALPVFTCLQSRANVSKHNLSGISALVTVLSGGVVLRQGSSTLRMSAGEIGRFDGGGQYTIENDDRASTSRVLLFIGANCPLPESSYIDRGVRGAEMARNLSFYASFYDGPMRLVGMRARRTVERSKSG